MIANTHVSHHQKPRRTGVPGFSLLVLLIFVVALPVVVLRSQLVHVLRRLYH